MSYYVFLGVLLIIGLSYMYIKVSFNKYKTDKIRKELSGCEIARDYLDKSELKSTYIIQTKSMKKNFCDYKRNTVKMSSDVFHEENISSSCTAAFLAAEMVNEKEGYSYTKFRNNLLPFIDICSLAGFIFALIGILMGSQDIIMLGTVILVIVILFYLLTISLSNEAIKKAKLELEKTKVLNKTDLLKANEVLNSMKFVYIANIPVSIIEMFQKIFEYAKK